jgi:hypothetical protein
MGYYVKIHQVKRFDEVNECSHFNLNPVIKPCQLLLWTCFDDLE